MTSASVSAVDVRTTMKFTYYGHSCFSVEIKGITILFDPFISGNELARSIDLNTLHADYLVVSHGHFDHILDAVAIAKRTMATVIANFEITTWFGNHGITNVHTLNPGGKSGFDFGIVKCFLAQHSSSFPDGSYAGVACGFAVVSEEGNFYYSGDTGLSLDMQLVSQSTELDYAVLPVGDHLTMGVEDAIQAARLLETGKVVGVHFDTFPQIVIDHQNAIELFQAAGMDLMLLDIGEVIEI
ncbi:L-ascorbate metabolism protein UlaG, beta-lactamase superfamily [Dyadobacter soli]|uniref:L-ascorbate metabolism protein UlaG, beta-lactamase superfamily n=1 Tax=Dyadobacter soli TaxID=659014 RepID=A0A1G7VPE0_9BACT|nr:metal-dependent hydrolase [Dyadobacter soli]SDG61428.1 L-ascorbate metabolism protein UlaG, beta-lactamase superfamily [Dyadobacter soli]